MTAATARLAPATVLCLGAAADAQPLIREALEEAGFDLLVRQTGPHQLNSILLVDPDLLLVDMSKAALNLPALLTALRENSDLSHLPVLVLLPAKHDAQVATDARAFGRVHCITAPFDAATLVHQVDIILNRPADAGVDADEETGAPHVKLGHLLDQRYRVLAQIGHGGKSKVYHALDTHVEPHAEVALKVWHLGSDHIADEQEVREFLREAYELSRLNHPNISHLVDFGQTEGFYYMATDFIQGRTLEDIIEKEGPIDERDALHVAHDVTAALFHLREHGLVHRDVKPANIMLTEDGRAILVDFGLARRITSHRLETDSDQAGDFHGSPHYASPEQVHGDRPLSIKSDIYNLGATLYHALSGRFVFDRGNSMNILLAHVEARPTRLAVICPNVSVSIACLVDRMLAKDPSHRPTLEKLRDQLDLISRGRSGDMSDTWTT